MSPIIQKLPILILSPHSRCNCRCAMCDIWKDSSVREIAAAELQRHVDDIRGLGVEWVIFTGGEPIMHSDLFRLCAILRPLGVRLTLLSSGLLLGRNARAVVDSFDEVIVSLDGPPAIHDRIRRVTNAFDLLAGGVLALRDLDRSFPISARCTVQKANHCHLIETIDAAREIQLQSISLLAADLDSTAFNRPIPWNEETRSAVGLDEAQVWELDAEVEAIIRNRAADIAIGFVRESPEKLRRIVMHFWATLGLAEPAAPRCNAPWVSAVIDADLTVRPCFFHPPIGSLSGKSLPAVLNGPAAIEFRRTLDIATNSTCRKCVCSLMHRNCSEGASNTVRHSLA